MQNNNLKVPKIRKSAKPGQSPVQEQIELDKTEIIDSNESCNQNSNGKKNVQNGNNTFGQFSLKFNARNGYNQQKKQENGEEIKNENNNSNKINPFMQELQKQSKEQKKFLKSNAPPKNSFDGNTQSEDENSQLIQQEENRMNNININNSKENSQISEILISDREDDCNIGQNNENVDEKQDIYININDDIHSINSNQISPRNVNQTPRSPIPIDLSNLNAKESDDQQEDNEFQHEDFIKQDLLNIAQNKNNNSIVWEDKEQIKQNQTQKNINKTGTVRKRASRPIAKSPIKEQQQYEQSVEMVIDDQTSSKSVRSVRSTKSAKSNKSTKSKNLKKRKISEVSDKESEIIFEEVQKKQKASQDFQIAITDSEHQNSGMNTPSKNGNSNINREENGDNHINNNEENKKENMQYRNYYDECKADIPELGNGAFKKKKLQAIKDRKMHTAISPKEEKNGNGKKRLRKRNKKDKQHYYESEDGLEIEISSEFSLEYNNNSNSNGMNGQQRSPNKVVSNGGSKKTRNQFKAQNRILQNLDEEKLKWMIKEITVIFRQSVHGGFQFNEEYVGALRYLLQNFLYDYDRLYEQIKIFPRAYKNFMQSLIEYQ